MTTDTHDNDLLRRMRDGDAVAFRTLYQRHQGPLYRFALLRCGSRETSADVVQEVFMGLMTGAFKFDPLRGQLPNFLFGVARNILLKQDAPRMREASLDEDAELVEEEGSSEAEPLKRLLHHEQAEAVRRALARLAPHYRDTVILYELHELSYLEIADICQVDIGTVRSRLSRARAALAKSLQPLTMHAA